MQIREAVIQAIDNNENDLLTGLLTQISHMDFRSRDSDGYEKSLMQHAIEANNTVAVSLLHQFDRSALNVLQTLTQSPLTLMIDEPNPKTLLAPLHEIVMRVITNESDAEHCENLLNVFHKLGADFNVKDEIGRNAIHMAVVHNNYTLIKLLAQLGCDIHEMDNYQVSVFDYAELKYPIKHAIFELLDSLGIGTNLSLQPDTPTPDKQAQVSLDSQRKRKDRKDKGKEKLLDDDEPESAEVGLAQLKRTKKTYVIGEEKTFALVDGSSSDPEPINYSDLPNTTRPTVKASVVGNRRVCTLTEITLIEDDHSLISEISQFINETKIQVLHLKNCCIKSSQFIANLVQIFQFDTVEMFDCAIEDFLLLELGTQLEKYGVEEGVELSISFQAIPDDIKKILLDMNSEKFKVTIVDSDCLTAAEIASSNQEELDVHLGLTSISESSSIIEQHDCIAYSSDQKKAPEITATELPYNLPTLHNGYETKSGLATLLGQRLEGVAHMIRMGRVVTCAEDSTFQLIYLNLVENVDNIGAVARFLLVNSILRYDSQSDDFISIQNSHERLRDWLDINNISELGTSRSGFTECDPLLSDSSKEAVTSMEVITTPPAGDFSVIFPSVSCHTTFFSPLNSDSTPSHSSSSSSNSKQEGEDKDTTLKRS